jgi:aminoglycoside phosphotransferase (APT) family kinase protein
MRGSDVEEAVSRATTAAAQRWPGATVASPRRLEGGVSSLTYAARLGAGSGPSRPVVLKIAPPGLPPVRNRDVLRQARILRQLAKLDGMPTPAVLFEDAGPPPLFAMDLCPGQSYEPALDHDPHPPAPDVAAARMRRAAKALARLHRDVPSELGLSGEPVVPVSQELARWARLFDTVDTDLAPGHAGLRDRLAERIPRDAGPRLLHGDYRLANMLFVERELTAVIDWEIWSVGDPRTDLAWLLMHTEPAHVFHEDRSASDLAAGAALPSAAEVLSEYAAARRADGASAVAVAGETTDLDWFLALSFYKTASTTAAIIKRDRRRSVRDPKLVVAARHLHDVLAAGHAALDRRARPRRDARAAEWRSPQ